MDKRVLFAKGKNRSKNKEKRTASRVLTLLLTV